MEIFFMHRIQETDGVFAKGIEIHNDLKSAIRSFWGRMKLAYNASSATYVSCKITDVNGNVIMPYDMTWQKEDYTENKFFFHHIRLDGETFSKDIDVCNTYDAACSAYAAAMEYGYDNPKFPNTKLVSCEITDRSGLVLKPFAETWIKPEPEPEPEPEPTPESEEE